MPVGRRPHTLPRIPEPADEVADRVFRLYRRHADDVGRVLDEANGRYARQLRFEELPAGCTLRLVFDQGSAPVPEPEAPKAPKPRPSRADKIRRLTQELVKFLRGAKESVRSTLDIGGVPVLPPRPSKKWLAKATKMTPSDVTNCFKDETARELRIYWDTAVDLDRVIAFSGPIGSDPAA